jgi:hypothetical protein
MKLFATDNDDGALRGRRIYMIAHLNRAFALLLIAVAMLPGRAFAQLSIPGKLVTYRTVDTDSSAEVQRTRSWQTSDGHATTEVTATSYPVGTQAFNECIFGNGPAKPATSFRSLMRTAGGELERSDFDTLDPTYYPFLSQPVTGDMQPASCLNPRALDLPTLISGGQLTMWTWSDSGLVGVTFQSQGDERLTVPAGTFDATKVRIDVDLSKLFPRVPALFLTLVKPHFTIWVNRAEPHYVLKMEGFGSSNGPHKNTVIELVAIGDLPAHDSPNAPGVPAELAQVNAIGCRSASDDG